MTNQSTHNERPKSRQDHAEDLGVFGPPVIHYPRKQDDRPLAETKSPEGPKAEATLAETEEEPAVPLTEEEKRQQLQARIAANASNSDPHSNYFVRYPEL